MQLLCPHTAHWHLMLIVFSAFVTHNAHCPGRLTVHVSQVPGCIPLHCVPRSVEMTIMATVHWVRHIAVMDYIPRCPSAHSTAGFSTLHWGHFELMNYCCLWYNGQNVSDFYQGGGRSVIFGAFVWKRWRKERKRSRERSACMKSGSQRFKTAGLSYIKQVSSADKKGNQAGREKNTGRGGKKQSKKGALCSLWN